MFYQNEFTDLIQACKYFYIILKNNASLSINLIINGITLNVNLYKLPPNTVVYNNDHVKSIFSLCNTDDCATQIILARSLTIATGVTFTPPYRCKGIIIYDVQDLINNGTISMTARGAHATGQNVWLYNNEYVPAEGATGAPSVSGWSGDPNTWIRGGNGYNGTGRQTGGGGGGIAGGAWRWGSIWFWTGRGGNGTSFSGGTGAGQWNRHSSDYWGPILDPNGTDDGGHGGHGSQNWDYAYSDYGCPGGVGNPSGRHTRWTGGRFTRELNASTDHNQASGTGGLLIIFAFNLQNNGSIDANGVASWHDGAGSSGGGSINIFYSKQFIRGSINAIGGQGGRYGGNGTISVDIIPSSYFPRYFLYNDKRLNSDIFKDSKPQTIIEYESLLDLLKNK